RSVQPLVSDRQTPCGQARVHLIERCEATPGESVPLDILHAALDFALRLCALVATQLHLSSVEVHPVFEPAVPLDFTARFVLLQDDRPRVVVQNRLSPSTEVRECCFVS